MENQLDELIGYRWAVEVAGVDVIHAGRDCLAQNRHGRINVAWKSPNSRTG
jgi:hypothetical protein